MDNVDFDDSVKGEIIREARNWTKEWFSSMTSFLLNQSVKQLSTEEEGLFSFSEAVLIGVVKGLIEEEISVSLIKHVLSIVEQNSK